MSIRERLSGNEAVANAMRQINPDVVAAFPITPSTEIPQYFSTFVNNGQVTTEFVPVESEHSAMSACIGAAAVGVARKTFASQLVVGRGIKRNAVVENGHGVSVSVACEVEQHLAFCFAAALHGGYRVLDVV